MLGDDWFDADLYPHEADDQGAGGPVDEAAGVLLAIIGSVGLLLCLIAAGFAAYYLG